VTRVTAESWLLPTLTRTDLPLAGTARLLSIIGHDAIGFPLPRILQGLHKSRQDLPQETVTRAVF
jgi:hypothetical protein